MPITTLSKGYLKPSNPTYGDLWFPAMETNIQKLNDHAHDGTDSALIASTLQSVLAASWSTDLGGGSYRQVITMPAGFSFDGNRIEVRRTDGVMVYPTIARITSNTFYIYTNNNSSEYTISYV